MARKGRVFLCHNSREKERIKALALDLLSSEGIRGWLDSCEIPGGADWEEHIRRNFALRWSLALCESETHHSRENPAMGSHEPC